MTGSYHCIVACTHLGNGTGRRTVTLAVPLALTSGPVRYEAVLYSCGKMPLGRGGGWHQLVTVCTHGDFIVLPHWDIRAPAPCPTIPLSHIILTLSKPAFSLS